MIVGGNIRDPMREANARLHYERESKNQKHLQDRRRQGGVAGLEDVAIGDEDQDLTMDEILKYKAEQDKKDSLRSRFNVWDVIIGATLGALAGSLLGALQINKVWRGESINYEAAANTMWGLLVGTAFGSASVALYQCAYVYCNKNARWAHENEARREALRRKEAEAIERHDEFVYYDAAVSHGKCMNLFCCLHWGKITTERIVYSTRAPWPAFSCCSKDWWWRMTCGRYARKTDTIDYDLVLDVSVEQSCLQKLLGHGTVIMHCEAAMDVSMIKDERDRIVRALQKQDEKALRQVIMTAGTLRPLKRLIDRAKNEANRLAAERKAKCEAEGKHYKPMYVQESKTENSAKTIRVLDVKDPFSVLDDISYRISKATDLSQRKALLMEAGVDAAVLGDEFLSEPETAVARAVTGASKA